VNEATEDEKKIIISGSNFVDSYKCMELERERKIHMLTTIKNNEIYRYIIHVVCPPNMEEKNQQPKEKKKYNKIIIYSKD
jgi:hypothetical protein